MSDNERLAQLRSFLAEAEADPENNLLYIQDLRESIELLAPKKRMEAVRQAERRRGEV